MIMDTILQRLQNGEDLDAIANELTIALNAANAEYERQKQEEKNAAARLDEIEFAMGNLFLEYMHLAAPHFIDDLTQEEATQIMSDSLRGTVKNLNLAERAISESKRTCHKALDVAEDALRQLDSFLHSLSN